MTWIYVAIGGALGALALLGLAACTTADLRTAQQTEPDASDFNAALYDGYLAFAEHERLDWDKDAEMEFARKAIDAANDRYVAPSDPAAAGVPEETLDEQAIRALTGDLDREREPEPTATIEAPPA